MIRAPQLDMLIKKLVLSQSNTVEIAKKDPSFKSLADLIENIISEKKGW